MMHDPLASDRPPVSDDRPPQFHLRGLLVAIGAIAVVLAAVRLGGYVALVALLAVGLVAAHVAGNAIGTKLRDTPHPPPPIPVRPALRLRPVPGRLSAPLPLGRGIWLAVGATALLGAALMAWLTHSQWDRLTLLGVAILELSAATIGAYFGFFLGRLALALRAALRQPGGTDD